MLSQRRLNVRHMDTLRTSISIQLPLHFNECILLQRADETNPDAANYTEAYEICEQNLASSCQASTLEDSVNGKNVTSMIEDCAMDVMVSGR